MTLTSLSTRKAVQNRWIRLIVPARREILTRVVEGKITEEGRLSFFFLTDEERENNEKKWHNTLSRSSSRTIKGLAAPESQLRHACAVMEKPE